MLNFGNDSTYVFEIDTGGWLANPVCKNGTYEELIHGIILQGQRRFSDWDANIDKHTIYHVLPQKHAMTDVCLIYNL